MTTRQAPVRQVFSLHVHSQRQVPLEPPLDQPTEQRVDIGRRQRRAPVQPPGQHGHERAGDILHRQIALLRCPLEGEGLQIDPGEIGDHALNALQDERGALPTRDGPPQGEIAACMLEHREAEAETARRLALLLADGAPQIFQPAVEQRLRVGEMRVERGATDVRPVHDVLHRRAVIPLLDHHRDQGFLEQLAGALHPPIRRLPGHAASLPNVWTLAVPNRTERA